MKKFLRIFAAVLALTAAAVNASALTPRWKEAAEKIAPLEEEYGYYDEWDVNTKIELVEILSEVGELSGRDVEKVLDENTKDGEKNGLCDKLLKAYVGGSLDLVTLESIVWGLHGENWSMEDKVWYSELLKKNGLASASDAGYTLPHEGELTEREAVDRARNFLLSIGASHVTQAHRIDATLEVDPEDYFDENGTQVYFKGRRTWSILFEPDPEKDRNYKTLCHVDMLATGEILNYHVPGMEYMRGLTGLLPDENAMPEDQALAIGKRAVADALGVAESELGTVRIYYGYITVIDNEVTLDHHKEYVWAVYSETLDAYALLSPGGNLIEAKQISR